MKIEVLRCRHCPRLAITVDDTRITSHKCQGAWSAPLAAADFDAKDIIAAALADARAEGRRAGMREAAKICDAVIEEYRRGKTEMVWTGQTAATRIRAAAEKEPA